MSNNPDQWNQQPGNSPWGNPDQSGQSQSSESQSGQSTWNDQSSNSSWGDQSNAGWNDQSSNSSWSDQSSNSSWDAQSYQSAPSWDSQQPSTGWDQPAQQPYQPYGAPAYPYAYPAMTGYQEAPDKGPGVTALVLALIALGISLILSVVGGLAYQSLFEALGPDWANNSSTVPDEYQDELMTAGLTIFGQIVPTILGIVALVLAGRAMGKPGSKGMGVFALITALAAPVISFVVWAALVVPAAS